MNTRRAAHAAGSSWRKWSDPLMFGPMAHPRQTVEVLAFWLACIDVGGALALWFR